MAVTVVRVLERVTARERSVWLCTFLGAWAVYLLTAHWATAQVNDTVAATWPAWQFVHTGSFDLQGSDFPVGNPWLVVDGARVVSARMMGVILAAVPFAAAFPWLSPDHVGPLAGATYTALAVANLHTLARGLVRERLALAGAVTLALGSPLWTTAAAEMWPHGPDACFISASLLAVQRQRYVLAGAALAPAVLTRPYLAVSAAVLGTWLAASTRSPRVLLSVGLPAASAVPLLLLWNDWYYGEMTLGGAYAGRAGHVLAPPLGDTLALFLRDAAGAFFSPQAGLFLYAPVFLVLLPFLGQAWRTAPAWCRAAGAAGVAYQVLQLRGNRFTGGGGFYSNRLVVELLVFLAPLLVLAAGLVLQRTHRTARLLACAAGASVGLHLFGALSTYFLDGADRSWWEWHPFIIMARWGPTSASLALVGAALPVLALLQYRRAAEPPVLIPAQRASRPAEPRARS